jgi:hypothetical protein
MSEIILKDLVWFSHCNQRIFIFKSIDLIKCPHCEEFLEKNETILFPVPNPFVSAEKFPDSILVKPSKGNFLEKYSPGDDLHIGICGKICGNSQIVSFDSSGLIREAKTSWDFCIFVVSRIELKIMADFWSKNLADIQRLNWSPQTYKSDSFNCFDFALAFINSLPIFDRNLQKKFEDIINFVDFFLKDKLKRAATFIKIYRTVSEKGFFSYQTPGDPLEVD